MTTAPGGFTRRGFIAAIGAGAAALARGAPSPARGAGSPEVDSAILNHALALEHLQAAFYTEAERLGSLGPVAAGVTEEIGAIERAHVAALTEALGDAALAPPLFAFGDATRRDAAFLRTAVALEDLAAATYQHQLPLISSPGHRALLSSIHTVDAGHAAWIRLRAGVAPVTTALDEPVAEDEATRLLLRSGLVRPRADAPTGSRWTQEAGEGGSLLAAFPLGRRPATGPAAAPEPATGELSPVEAEAHPWLPWIATTGALSAVVLGGLGLRAHDGRRRVTVVGPDQGPAVSQHAHTTAEVAGDAAATQTAGVPRSAAPRERV